jgi:threonine 3-dehydrogenase
LHIKGVYGREMFETWYKMSAVLQSGLDITPVITHTFGVDDFQEAFRIMNTGRACKIVLNWD